MEASLYFNDFNVLSGTTFQGTHVPLQKWFLAIALIMNAKKSLSSCQLARDLGLNQKTAWYMQQRIRSEMGHKQGLLLLEGIIEADETYVDGKPRKKNKRDDDTPAPRGRATKKTSVIGSAHFNRLSISFFLSNFPSEVAWKIGFGDAKDWAMSFLLKQVTH